LNKNLSISVTNTTNSPMNINNPKISKRSSNFGIGVGTQNLENIGQIEDENGLEIHL